MASLLYTFGLCAGLTGELDFASDDFKVMLVGSGYVPDKEQHKTRRDVTDEVDGVGYVEGGVSASVVATIDEPNHRIDIVLGAAKWPNSTITARGAVYYQSQGDDPAEDHLVAYVDFGGDVVSMNGSFALSESVLRVQN